MAGMHDSGSESGKVGCEIDVSRRQALIASPGTRTILGGLWGNDH
jgi:hypothetical protein